MILKNIIPLAAGKHLVILAYVHRLIFRKSLLCFGLLLLLNNLSFSQKQANIWHFGDGRCLDFSSGAPVNISGSQMSTTEGCASYCDKYGNFLFYTNGGGREPAVSSQDGGHIWNRNNAVMYDMLGTEGGGFSSAQSSIIFEAPGQDSVYYVFTMDELEWYVGASPAILSAQPLGRGLSYFTVDMRLNGGLGGVVTANQFLHKPSYEGLCAVRHANGRDYWVIISQDSSGLGIYSVTPSGVAYVNTYIGPGRPSYHVIKASPSGNYVTAFFDDNAGSTYIPYLLQFDKANGQFSNPVPFSQQAAAFEFSPGSRFLYSLENTPAAQWLKIVQYDLQSSNIVNSGILIDSIDNMVFTMQLGPDGRIYFVSMELSSFTHAINRINCPNTFGASLETDVFTYFPNSSPFYCLPNFPAWLFENYDSVYVSLGPDTVNLCDVGGSYVLDALNPGASYLWSNGATTQTITVTSPGTYSVAVTGPCGTGNDTIVVVGCCTGMITNSPDSCLQGNVSFSITTDQTITAVNWNFGDPGSGASNTSVALTPTHNFSAAGTYTVTCIVNFSCGADTITKTLTIVDCGNPFYLDIISAPDTCLQSAITFSINTNRLIEQIIEWNFNDPASGSNNTSTLGSPTHVFSNTGTYTVSLILQINCGTPPTPENPIGVPCFFIDTIYLTINIVNCDTIPDECNLFVPSAFTPNGDGINDRFYPLTKCTLEDYELMIYNRWGEQVYKTTNPSDKWDGKYKKSDCPTGAYVYMIKYGFPSQQRKMVKGTISLFR